MSTYKSFLHHVSATFGFVFVGKVKHNFTNYPPRMLNVVKSSFRVNFFAIRIASTDPPDPIFSHF